MPGLQAILEFGFVEDVVILSNCQGFACPPPYIRTALLILQVPPFSDVQLITDRFPGIRVVRQDPVECLFSFIASSNNNISRITQVCPQ